MPDITKLGSVHCLKKAKRIYKVSRNLHSAVLQYSQPRKSGKGRHPSLQIVPLGCLRMSLVWWRKQALLIFHTTLLPTVLSGHSEHGCGCERLCRHGFWQLLLPSGVKIGSGYEDLRCPVSARYTPLCWGFFQPVNTFPTGSGWLFSSCCFLNCFSLH